MKNTNLKYLLLAAFSLLGSIGAHAEAETASGGFSFDSLFLVVILLVVIIAFWVIGKGLNVANLKQEEGVKRGGAENQSFWAKLTDATPVEHEADVMLDHDYDGIRELDNKLPPWWVALFYITIAWAVVYIGYFHVLKLGPLQAEEYKIKMQKADEEVAAHLATLGAQVDENTAELKEDAASLEQGKKLFVEKCAACHKADGGGNIGPNLTDKYWLHGSGIKNIFKTVKYGVPSTAMAPWDNKLSPLEIQDVASFVVSLQGTNPPDAKEPQGKEE